MKKSKKILILVLVLLLIGVLAVGGIVSLTDNFGEPAPEVPEKVDIGWYDETGKEFQLTTVEQLYGLAELSKTYDFKGQTIKLGTDVVINEGDATGWAQKAPEHLWTPVTGFAGTFDGQGYTISGVYGNSIVTSLGLFTDTRKDCVIRNLKLVNSCFKNNNDLGTGSIIGIGGGTLENIYSDAVMVSAGKNIGGLIGCVKTKGENQIINCWFDGSIIMDGYDCSGVGGLVGAYTVEDAINTIDHCLSTADIDSMGENVGGVCGYVGNGAFLNLNDSMFTGTLAYDTNKYAVVGSVVGQVMGSASIIVNDTYTVDEIANRTIGTSDGYQKGNAIAVNKSYLLGKAGYQWTTLDFENYWVAQKDAMPRLGYFTQATESVDGVEKMVDISWYDPTGAAFEITNAQQLYGFAYLSRSYDFRGQTIKLVADITVNEGDASTWGEKAPAYNWTPIAWYGSSLSQRFKGTFDGQGHTISGIYAKGTQNVTCIGLFGEIYHGAVVKDFKLVNSYLEGVLDSSVRGPVGSIAGRLRGTIENVYSDAIVVNSSKNTGGIVGMITGTGQNKISGCWFDGKLTGITRSGGILGGVYGNKGNIEATIEHCLNTGEMNIQYGQAGVGGICGTAETWSILYVDDCLNAGTYQTFGTGTSESKHIGTLVGTVTKTDGVGSKAIVTDSYGVKEFYDRLVGWEHGDEGIDWNSMMYVEADELAGYNGYRWTSLDFKEHWSVRSNACPVPAAFASEKLSTAGVVRMVDYSWYDPHKTTNTVRTFQQLYGMARLWEVTNLFKGETVLLGADITINKGNAADWAKTAPAYVWEPARFNGTFDGQGHTISGVYVKGEKEDNYVGFFHRIYQNGTVKNLKLKNSYIEGTMPSSDRGATGSLAGRSNGIIDTVYSDAIVVNSARMTGGLVGMITGEGENVIRNSWFDGKVTGITRTGGILGGIYGNKSDIQVTIENCTNTGDIAVKIGQGDVGGICGMAETGGKLTIADCLNAGTYQTVGDDKEANTHVGSIFGSVTEKDGNASHVVLDNVYGVGDFYSKLVGWKYDAGGVSSSAAILLDMETLTAQGGYRYARLDYTEEFALNKSGIPVPKAFGVKTVAASDLVDYSWFDIGKSEYTLTTAAQLEAFNVLCNEQNSYFSGKTVKLGADISMNEGKAADWAAAAPEKTWTPITFSGTFDGQGHTVSGLYINSTKQYTGLFSTVNSGATVKNLKLTNSYIEGNGSETRSGVGSIAGRSHGTIDTVYSSAILKNSKQMTGGIVGMVTGDGENRITNCWFDGQIDSIAGTGGILGSSYGQSAVIEHCLNTGKLNVTSGSQVGGLCGYAQGAANVTITDSLNAGQLSAAEGVKQIGAIVGSLHNNGTLVLTNAYGVKNFAEKGIGYISSGTLTDNGSAVNHLDDIKSYGAYQRTSLDFEGGHWVLKKDAVPTLGAFNTADLSLEEAKKLPDYRWYNESSDVYVISTALQLLAFNDLCDADTDYFAGKTVKLAADITLTGGSETEANWTPIRLKGTFDGQGHTVSGVYVIETNENIGFFSYIYNGATVKNLSFKDSYIEHYGDAQNNRAAVGSIAGQNRGTIEAVYSNAVLKNNKLMTGGIVGMTSAAGENKISNCWFDGQIIAGGSTGGILGGTYAAEATVEHCLNTGSITVETNGANLTAIGGLCGYSQSTGGVTVYDSLNAGTVMLSAKDGNTIKQVGTIIGAIHAKAAATRINSAYGVKEFSTSAIGYGDLAADSANYNAVGKDSIKGFDAYYAMALDFEVKPYWVLMDGDLPGLATFREGTLAVADAKSQPDTSWYDPNADTYVISTTAQICGYAKLLEEGVDFSQKTITLGADTYELGSGEQLRAFAAVCKKNNFAGKTVALTANINLGGADTPWTPVSFGGTFDGQGYSISGAYVTAETQYTGLFHTVYTDATVRNLKLVDSYIEGNGSETRSGVGSIAGRNYGTIDTVYSSATVKNSKQMTGGIVGMSFGGTITNCWFDGTIYGVKATGGILGGAYNNTALISHCMFTGTIIDGYNSSKALIGGLCGYAQNSGTNTASVTIRDSLSAGTLESMSTSQIGAIFGGATKAMTIGNVYAATDTGFGSKNYGWAGVEPVVEADSVVVIGALESLCDSGAEKLDYNNYWTVREGKIPILTSFVEWEKSLGQ